MTSTTPAGHYTTATILLLLYGYYSYSARIKNLSQLVETNRPSVHLYADDTQIHGVCHSTDDVERQQQMSACTNDVTMWRSLTDFRLTQQRVDRGHLVLAELTASATLQHPESWQ